MSKQPIVGPYTGVTFGSMIREAFDKSGMTQVQFAQRLGVTQPRIVEIFNQASMTEALLDRCMVALRVKFEARIVA